MDGSNAIAIVAEVSVQLYSGNLRILSVSDRSHIGRQRCTFSIGSKDAGKGIGVGYTVLDGKYCVSQFACWHAHYDVMDKIFTRFPLARIETTRTPIFNNATFDSVMYRDGISLMGELDGIGEKARWEACECGADAWPFEIGNCIPAQMRRREKG